MMKKINLLIIGILLFNFVSAQTHDLEIIKIYFPNQYANTHMPIRPVINIHNNGSATEDSYQINIILTNQSKEEVYNSTVTVSNANFGADEWQRINFIENWTPEEDGIYVLVATVILDGDENPSNDTFENNILAQDLNIAYAWQSGSNIHPFGAAMFYYNNTYTCQIQPINEWGNSDTFMAGADFVGDTWYAVQYAYDGSSKIFTIDTETGIPTEICEADQSFSAMAYDVTTQTVYATNSSDLYTLNIETGETQFLGTGGNSYVGIACDNEGNLYGMQGYAANCGLYSINKTNGAQTLIGETTGLSIITAQDIAYDRCTNTLYGAFAGNGNGGFYKINTETGQATLLEDYANSMAGFAIPYIPKVILTMPEDGATQVDAFEPTIFAKFQTELTEIDLSQITLSAEATNLDIDVTIEGSYILITNNEELYPFAEHTVTIPAGSIKTGEYENTEFSWSFTSHDWDNVNEINSMDINIFPNPTTDFINVNTKNTGTYEILDITGKQISTGNIANGNNIIFLKNQEKGIYFINIKTENQIFTEKIIIL